MKKLPTHPANPERVCWGCDRLCPAHDLGCGNGTDRTMHPIELFGPSWLRDEEEAAQAAGLQAVGSGAAK